MLTTASTLLNAQCSDCMLNPPVKTHNIYQTQGMCQNEWHMHGVDGRAFPFLNSLRLIGSMRVSHFNVHTPETDRAVGLDWCCFYYSIRNSLVAFLEGLFARVMRQDSEWSLDQPKKGENWVTCDSVVSWETFAIYLLASCQTDWLDMSLYTRWPGVGQKWTQVLQTRLSSNSKTANCAVSGQWQLALRIIKSPPAYQPGCQHCHCIWIGDVSARNKFVVKRIVPSVLFGTIDCVQKKKSSKTCLNMNTETSNPNGFEFDWTNNPMSQISTLSRNYWLLIKRVRFQLMTSNHLSLINRHNTPNTIFVFVLQKYCACVCVIVCVRTRLYSRMRVMVWEIMCACACVCVCMRVCARTDFAFVGDHTDLRDIHIYIHVYIY